MRHLSWIIITAALGLAGCGGQPALPTALPAVTLQPATASAAPAHLPNVDWLTYHDDVGGFSIQHPLTWQQRNNPGDPIEFVLTAAPGTTLLEKLLDIDVTPNAGECRERRYDGGGSLTSESVTRNGVNFLKETGAGLGAGNIYEWTGYSTQKGATCITITFVLHSANPGVYATPPPAFDAAAESQVFEAMLDTFRLDP